MYFMYLFGYVSRRGAHIKLYVGTRIKVLLTIAEEKLPEKL
jgi:hypothetical protein